MEKRIGLHTYGYLFFAVLILIVNWESNLADAALLESDIPREAIRIRIVANSDAVEDQWIKKQVRDAVTARINRWDERYADIGEARRALNRRLPELKRLVDSLLTKYGFAYGYSVELGKIEFPVKKFDGKLYPAGRYEALLITLGEGRGENWWCVLFPPLCFGSGTIKANPDDAEGAANVRTEEPGSGNTAEPAAEAAEGKQGPAGAEHGRAAGPEVRFFLIDSLKKTGSYLKGLFV